jgi:hypothetical protein
MTTDPRDFRQRRRNDDDNDDDDDLVVPIPCPVPQRADAPSRTYRDRAEYRYDCARLRRVAAAVTAACPRLVVDVDDAERWTDRWRVPVGVSPGTPFCLDASHFRAVAAAGGALVVEERFNARQMNTYFVDVPRARFRGWRAWSPRTRVTCVVATAVALGSAAMLVAGYLVG